MMKFKRHLIRGSLLLSVTFFLPAFVIAQDGITVLTGAELTRIVPPGFYFQGLTAPTQMRNSAAARFGANRYVIAGLVDNSGYAADVRAKYEGFLIADLPITINGRKLPIGAYGFGFSNDGKLNIMNLAGDEILSVSTTKDIKLKRPRPLMLMDVGTIVRF